MKTHNSSRYLTFGGLTALILLVAIFQLHGANRGLAGDLGALRESAPTLLASLDHLKSALASIRHQEEVTADAEDPAKAVLLAIEKLKNDHAANPPPPPKPAPPRGPRGRLFPELLGDPEYSRLYKGWVKRTMGTRERTILQQLGLSAEAVEKVVDLLGDQQLVSDDLAGLASDQTRNSGLVHSSATDEGRVGYSLRKEIDEEIRVEMGDDNYQAYLKLKRSDMVAGSLVHTLSYRLSYSDTPLLPPQEDALNQLLHNAVPPAHEVQVDLNAPMTPEHHQLIQRTMASNAQAEKAMMELNQIPDSLLSQASSILSLGQIDAWRQIRTERQARDQLSKLPKL